MKTMHYYLLTILSIFCGISAIAAGGPVAVPDDFELQLTSDAIVINVLLNDTYNPEDSITLTLLSQPTFGIASVDEKTNQIIFQSKGNDGGEISFEYELCSFSAQCGNSCSIAGVKVKVLNQPVVPEGLTLNGDGFNEGLRLTNIRDYNKLEITIVNRWGHIVYRNKNYDNENPWRGNYGGTNELVKPGVYYYYLRPFRNGKPIGDIQTAALYIFN